MCSSIIGIGSEEEPFETLPGVKAQVLAGSTAGGKLGKASHFTMTNRKQQACRIYLGQSGTA